MTLAAGKSSIGHTEPAAGLAGIYHALHTMQSSMIQPILHFRQVRIAAAFSTKPTWHRLQQHFFSSVVWLLLCGCSVNALFLPALLYQAM